MKIDGKIGGYGAIWALKAKDSRAGDDGLYSLKDENGVEYERVYYYVAVIL